MFISSLIYIQVQQGDFNKGRTIKQSSQPHNFSFMDCVLAYPLTFVKCISYGWFPPFIICSCSRENENVFEEISLIPILYFWGSLMVQISLK